jgi:hydrogenase-4 component B
MLLPLLLPIAGCIVIGVAPLLVIGFIDQGVETWLSAAPTAAELAATGPVSLASLAPLSWISGIAALLAGLMLVLAIVFRWRLRAEPVGSSGTWDCGYAQPTARMQYTAASFAQILVLLFTWILRPRISGTRVSGLFPQKANFSIQAIDIVLDRFVMPVTELVAGWFAWLRLLQQGVIQVYLLYIFLIIVALLVWA